MAKKKTTQYKMVPIIVLIVVCLGAIVGGWYGMYRLIVSACKTAIEESK